MLIYTVTLNPAIDETTILDKNNRVKEVIVQAAGKGINVSLALNSMGLKSTVVALIGGKNGRYIQNQLQDLKLPLILINLEGNTRINKKIVYDDGMVDELNEPGPKCTTSVITELVKKLLEVVKKDDIVVLSGSIPRGLPNSTYQSMIETLNKKGLITVLDADNESLKNGLLANPTIIKPNQGELGQVFNTKIGSVEAAIDYGKKLYKNGVKEVLITLGSLGSILVSSEIYFAHPLNIDVKNTVGAGDSFLAGFLYGKAHGHNLKESIKYAVAFASSAVGYQGTGIENNQLNMYLKQVVIDKIDS